ncbi:hypothetical protein CYMTET_26799 [Cymbomonas tetramitiformis]|uniref:Uncharacterized protein n=1 Tax=Cymbomonas tetramitiformis TaxID=36881 RepID=A0AAE0FRJ3_9CHLO|nr:hypothetical protein CYMTET_26799 [Cymbomonas tetramitiformis]
MFNAQLIKALRPKTKSRTDGSRKRESEDTKLPAKRTRLPEIVKGRPEEFCKLGLPEAANDTEELEGKGEHQILRHVRPITGCDLTPEETNKYGLPLQGSPQMKITDLRETQSAAISHIRKGARDETPADNKIREVLFLVSHHQDLAQLLIKDKNLDFGFPTRKGLLPSAADKQALSQREVAVIDYSQQLFVGHRTRIVSAITKKLSELALRHKQPSYGEDSYLVFEKHLGTPRWAPSDNTVESLLQWKRNSNDTINFYAILTESAYDLLVSAGSSITVDVHLNDDEDTGEKVLIPVKVEVGRWSLMGSKSRSKQTAPPRRQHQEGSTDEKTLRETSEAAIYNMQKTTEECLKKVQQATTQARKNN